MKWSVRLSLQLLLAALIVVSAGCRQPPKPMRFNNMIARGNQRLEQAAKQFYKAVEPLGQGKNAEVSSVRTAYNSAENALKELRKDFDSQKPPVNSQPGEDLLEKYRDFLLKQQEIFDQCFTPMLAAAEDNSKSPADKWAIIEPLITKASDLETPVRGALIKLQAEYAKHHNLDPRS